MGAFEYEHDDDYGDFAVLAAQGVARNPEYNRGIVICGSGVGMDVTANKVRGVRCGLGWEVDQVFEARKDDNINVLSLAAENVDEEKAVRLVETYEYGELSVSVVTIQELFAGTSSKDQEEEILKLLSGLKIWPYTEAEAKRAGELGRDINREMGFADAVIAATAVMNGCQLATLDKADFSGISGLVLVGAGFIKDQDDGGIIVKIA